MSFISPFTDVLRTNYAPTSTEIDLIERALEAPSAEIESLGAQLLQLQEQLDAKRTREENLLKSIAEHQNLLSPFRYLPDDILSEIFIAYLPTKHEAILNHSEPPLILGRVCRRWRSVAYGTPRLWASLHIAIPTPPDFYPCATQETRRHFTQIFSRNVNRHLIIITMWLRRSKACPLSISIHDPYSSSSESPFPPAFLERPYYNLMFTFSNRIRRLELDISQQLMSDILATVPPTSFPHLQVLLLNFHSRLRNSPMERWRNSRLLNVPNLRYLSISRCSLKFEEMTVNWSHLTQIVVAGSRTGKVNVLDVQKIFTRCPRLRFCNIDIECSLTALETCIPFSLPYLHTLIIIDDSSCLEALFEYANMPALQNLSYHPKFCPSHEWWSPLIAILACTHGRVQRLTTNIQFFTLADLVECFNMTPSLSHLTNMNCISGSSSPQRRFLRALPIASKMLSALLRLLTPAPDCSIYLPKLQVVSFDLTYSVMKVSDWEILDFLRGRMQNASGASQVQVAALTEVSFVLMHDVEIDLRAKLSDYVVKGMKLHLRYLGEPYRHHIGAIRKWYPSFGRGARRLTEGIYL